MKFSLCTLSFSFLNKNDINNGDTVSATTTDTTNVATTVIGILLMKSPAASGIIAIGIKAANVVAVEAIIGVDGPRRVDNGDPLLDGQPGTRPHLRLIADVVVSDVPKHLVHRANATNHFGSRCAFKTYLDGRGVSCDIEWISGKAGPVRPAL